METPSGKYGHEYELALKARGGDSEAIAELVELTRMRLFAQAHAILNHYDDAQDAVAAALLQMCLHIGQLRDPENIVPWVQSIVRREALRLRQGREIIPLREEEADQRSEDTVALLRLDIERALQRLPGQQAQALRLFYMDGLSVREVADALSTVNIGTVKVWLHRGRRHLAAEMKGYFPMTKPTIPEGNLPAEQPAERLAAILHSDLAPDLLQAVSDALRKAGFTPRMLTPADLPAPYEDRFTEDQLTLRDILKSYGTLVVDEMVGKRSGLEYVLFCKAHAETANILITLLHSQEKSALLDTACFAAGVSHLISKKPPYSFVATPNTGLRATDTKLGWQRFTERARQIVFRSQQEAIRLGTNEVATEHLLLGLVDDVDSVAVRILVDMGVSLQWVTAEVERQAEKRTDRDKIEDMTLSEDCKRVIDCAYDEANRLDNNFIGSEHLLLGLVRETEGLAAHILTESGVTLERIRNRVEILRAESLQ